MAQPMNVTVTLDLPDGVTFLGYERVGDGHGIEVKFRLPNAMISVAVDDIQHRQQRYVAARASHIKTTRKNCLKWAAT